MLKWLSDMANNFLGAPPLNAHEAKARAISQNNTQKATYCPYCGDYIEDTDIRMWHVREEHPLDFKPSMLFCVHCGCYDRTEPHRVNCTRHG